MSNNSVTSIMDSEKILQVSQHYIASFTELVESVPGGAILVRYIQLSYQDDPIRSVVELFLFLFAIRYFLSKKTSPDSKAKAALSEKEIDEICRGWKPQPLADPVSSAELYKLKRIPISDGTIDTRFDMLANDYLANDYTVHNADVAAIGTKELKDVVNLASYDFLSMSHDTQLVKYAEEIIKNHGVGACGPPGFYGNQDIHIRLENKLAEWFGTEAAIIYGQDFCTALSIIPAFLKRGDIAIVDAGVNLSIQKAVILSRCQVFYYKHNDLDHLAAILSNLQDELKDIKPLNRRFIITEGLFANYGDYPDVAKLVQLKETYKFRLFLDETLSVGVIGEHGRGLTELYNVPSNKVDILVGSLANSMASSGGFCVGAKPMVFNQRIASAAYCFSASLPPYCAKVALEWINIVEKDSGKNLIKKLNDNTIYFHTKASKNRSISKYANVVSDKLSSLVLIEFNQATKNKLGFKRYYINENNKFAAIHEKGMKFYEEGLEEPTKPLKKPAVSENERVDYYSEAAIKKRKAQEKAKMDQQANKISSYELFNLEEFLITKVANDLLIKDKILIISAQRLLKLEILRVSPHFRIALNNSLSKSELDTVIERFGFHLNNVLANLHSRKDVEDLLLS